MAKMKLPYLFSDHTVLQRNKPINIWGEGKGRISVTLDGDTVYTYAYGDRWSAILPARDAGGPYTMIIEDETERIVLNDVMVGDVWMAAGQSNMENITFITETGFEDARQLGNNDNIRFFTVPRRTEPDRELYHWHFESQKSVDNGWEICTEETALHFTAIGFVFAALLQHDKNIPVGIISCNWGGTKIEAWMEQSLFSQNSKVSYVEERHNKILCELDMLQYRQAYEEYRRVLNGECEKTDAMSSLKKLGLHKFARTSPIKWPAEPPFGPLSINWYGVLYENMVKRVIPYTLKGVLWYQGESNCAESEAYFDLFSLLVSSWRKAWNDELPFLTVQIAPFNYPEENAAPDMWYQQIRAAFNIDGVAIVTTSDIGETDNIHPVNKRPIAERLYLAAKNTVYGEDCEYCGPLCTSAEKNKDGTVTVSFAHAQSGLCCEGDVSELYICGEDMVYKEAQSRIEGDKLVVWNEDITSPEYVKMGYSNFPKINLYNKAGFIAAGFSIKAK